MEERIYISGQDVHDKIEEMRKQLTVCKRIVLTGEKVFRGDNYAFDCEVIAKMLDEIGVHYSIIHTKKFSVITTDVIEDARANTPEEMEYTETDELEEPEETEETEE